MGSPVSRVLHLASIEGARMVHKVSTYPPIYSQNLSPSLSAVRDITLLSISSQILRRFPYRFQPLAQSNRTCRKDLYFGKSWYQVFSAYRIFLQVSSRTGLRQIAAVAIPLAPILIWILLSFTWSHFPDVTIRRSIRIVMETATALLFAATYREQYKLLRVIYLTFCTITAIDVALLAAPDLSFSPEGFTGVHYHKNDAGAFYLITLPVFLLAFLDPRISHSRAISAAFTVACLGLLVLSGSKTSLPVAPLCLAFTFGLTAARRFGSRHTIATALMIACAVGIFVMFVALVSVDRFLSYFVEDLTFSGRTVIWDYAMIFFGSIRL